MAKKGLTRAPPENEPSALNRVLVTLYLSSWSTCQPERESRPQQKAWFLSLLGAFGAVCASYHGLKVAVQAERRSSSFELPDQVPCHAAAQIHLQEEIEEGGPPSGVPRASINESACSSNTSDHSCSDCVTNSSSINAVDNGASVRSNSATCGTAFVDSSSSVPGNSDTNGSSVFAGNSYCSNVLYTDTTSNTSINAKSASMYGFGNGSVFGPSKSLPAALPQCTLDRSAQPRPKPHALAALHLPESKPSAFAACNLPVPKLQTSSASFASEFKLQASMASDTAAAAVRQQAASSFTRKTARQCFNLDHLEGLVMSKPSPGGVSGGHSSSFTALRPTHSMPLLHHQQQQQQQRPFRKACNSITTTTRAAAAGSQVSFTTVSALSCPTKLPNLQLPASPKLGYAMWSTPNPSPDSHTPTAAHATWSTPEQSPHIPQAAHTTRVSFDQSPHTSVGQVLDPTSIPGHSPTSFNQYTSDNPAAHAAGAVGSPKEPSSEWARAVPLSLSACKCKGPQKSQEASGTLKPDAKLGSCSLPISPVGVPRAWGRGQAEHEKHTSKEQAEREMGGSGTGDQDHAHIGFSRAHIICKNISNGHLNKGSDSAARSQQAEQALTPRQCPQSVLQRVLHATSTALDWGTHHSLAVAWAPLQPSLQMHRHLMQQRLSPQKQQQHHHIQPGPNHIPNDAVSWNRQVQDEPCFSPGPKKSLSLCGPRPNPKVIAGTARTTSVVVPTRAGLAGAGSMPLPLSQFVELRLSRSAADLA